MQNEANLKFEIRPLKNEEKSDEIKDRAVSREPPRKRSSAARSIA
jgi:hypothetical protein